MSHFSVMVRVPAGTEDVEPAIAALLAPYQENNMGDCPKQYMEFNDEEDEYLEEYRTESTQMIKLPDGTLVYSHDERFRVPGKIGIGGGTHKVPDELERVNVAHSTRFETFERFVAEWHGREERDPEKGRYGYWENPNKKWDWYQIGGRFGRKMARQATEEGGWCRIADLDLAAEDAETMVRAKKFWEEWVQFANGKQFPFFYGPREEALSLGLIACKNADELTGNEWRTIKWDRQLKPGVDRFDVLAEISEADAIALYRRCCYSLQTFAYLDHTGWHAPGKIGWWAFTDASPESTASYADDFETWLKSGNRNDIVAVVDCHI